MAVYELGYRMWQGTHTPATSRFLVIPKYALKPVFKSRAFNWFYIGSFLSTVIFMAMLYVWHNLDVFKLLSDEHAEILSGIKYMKIDAEFFFIFFNIQSVLSFLIIFIVGPTLISVDMTNNALPLYLSRPFSKAEYILGKMSVLIILLSPITWVSGLIIYLFHCSLSVEPVFWAYIRIPIALFVSFWLLILFLSITILALSAYVKRKHVARGIYLSLFFILSGTGEVVNNIFHTTKGSLFRIHELFHSTAARMFGVRAPDIPELPSYFILGGICVFCMFLLERRIKPVEVVK
ncbi:ABC transporter permease subunit [candidate division CSSED10-310 bacterium]|uniref:ABC transporter permease subunit n=1 Tax=candidate division CSSED10-310 bacterium TaxID=2855610 RepID=A0ABV6Z1Y1_UNCC1